MTSTRVKNPTIPSEYILYLQELDYNIGVEHHLETFSHATSSKNSDL